MVSDNISHTAMKRHTAVHLQLAVKVCCRLHEVGQELEARANKVQELVFSKLPAASSKQSAGTTAMLVNT